MHREELLKRIESDKERILNLCKKLVQIPSENPPGDTQAIVKFLGTLFQEKGLPYEIYAPQAHMPNFVARLQGKEGGRRLVLNGHLDTFPTGDREAWTHDPFGGCLEDGKIFGRGVSDMKGGDVASLMSFFYLAEQRERVRGEVVLTLVSDEETGGEWGTAWLLDHVPEVRGDAVINGEPGSCELVHFAEKGLVWIEVISRGKAASAAYPHFGSNAIEHLYHFLHDLEKLEILQASTEEISRIQEEGEEAVDAIKGRGATEILKLVTVNVGTIAGGLKCNLIPDFCRAEVDIRFPHGVCSSDIFLRIETIRSKYPGIEYKVNQVAEPNYTPIDQQIVQLVKKNAESVRGHRIYLSGGMNGTDCRHFRNRGIPACMYGPRNYQLGGTDEYIYVQDLMDAVKVHTLTAFDFLS
ncbi:MAG: ArgE/DapE family deacylase [Deltaproteobacteria bacterium]|nr:ArgE/DapE family deacylase [Deltaproteobacteria bacterium]